MFNPRVSLTFLLSYAMAVSRLSASSGASYATKIHITKIVFGHIYINLGLRFDFRLPVKTISLPGVRSPWAMPLSDENVTYLVE